jgi:hypothetical protein
MMFSSLKGFSQGMRLAFAPFRGGSNRPTGMAPSAKAITVARDSAPGGVTEKTGPDAEPGSSPDSVTTEETVDKHESVSDSHPPPVAVVVRKSRPAERVTSERT